jgi:hypothetical protein
MNQIKFIQKNKDCISEIKHNEDNIYLFTQFYIDSDKIRHQEIKETLKKNIELGCFKNIFLLNEKIYTNDELGLSSDEMNKIVQINIKHRLKYSSIIFFINLYRKNINGYIVITNNDIFFDNSINNIRYTSLSKQKSLYALSRFENNDNLAKNSAISQDTWIFHTFFIYNEAKYVLKQLISLTNFELGRVGCDNRIAYIFWKFGYTVYNEPYIIKTYHNHLNQNRNESDREKNRIKWPYLFIESIERNINKNIL